MGVRSRNNAELKGWTQRLEEFLALSDREQVPATRGYCYNERGEGWKGVI